MAKETWMVCNHVNTFDEGLCWAIINPDMYSAQTEAKFCQAHVDGAIRRFDNPHMGFMEPKPHDIMVTKKCLGCKDAVLLRVTETLCALCTEKELVRESLLRLESLSL